MVLQGYISILKKKEQDPFFQDYLNKITSSAQRITTMIQFTREYEKIGVDAPVWQDCRTLVENAAIEVLFANVKIQNSIPKGTGVFADSLIVEVFYNLIDNALQYGRKITTIQFSLEEREGENIIICKDDGDGIPEEEKEKIFERGYGKNTGLGLFLSREVLSITGITIFETGNPENGAMFVIRIPTGMFRSVNKY